MKTELVKKPFKQTVFGDLSPGETFITQSGNGINIRIHPDFTPNTYVSLETGRHYVCDLNVPVTRVRLIAPAQFEKVDES